MRTAVRIASASLCITSGNGGFCLAWCRVVSTFSWLRNQWPEKKKRNGQQKKNRNAKRKEKGGGGFLCSNFCRACKRETRSRDKQETTNKRAGEKRGCCCLLAVFSRRCSHKCCWEGATLTTKDAHTRADGRTWLLDPAAAIKNCGPPPLAHVSLNPTQKPPG